MTKSICITGMGIISSIGDDVSTFSTSLKMGKSGIKKFAKIVEPKLSINIGAQINEFVFLEKLEKYTYLPGTIFQKAKRLGQRAPFTIQVSILSALQAWNMAGLFNSNIDPDRIGLILAGQNTTQNYQYSLIPKFRENPQYLSPRYGLEFLESNQIGILSDLLNIKGEGIVVSGASATGNVGIIKGYQAIHSGLVDICVVVGAVADLSPMDIQGFYNMGAMGGRMFANQPEKACRPFDSQHEGFIYGQAGACIILESSSSISKRDTSALAELLGGVIRLDGNSSSDPNINGEMNVMLSAINKSGVSISDIEYVNTHGSSSPLGDRTEAEAIMQVFGAHVSNVWLNSTKSMTGHCLYSAAIVEAIATIIQMRENFLHPNLNLYEPIVNGLKYCGLESVCKKINTAMSNSFGFGGINTSIVLASA